MTHIKLLIRYGIHFFLFLIIIHLSIVLFVTTISTIAITDLFSVRTGEFFVDFIEIWTFVCGKHNCYGFGYLPYDTTLLVAAYIGLYGDQNIAYTVGNAVYHLLKRNRGTEISGNIIHFGKFVILVTMEFLTFGFTFIYSYLSFLYRDNVSLLPYPASVFFAGLLCIILFPSFVFIKAFWCPCPGILKRPEDD